MVSAVVCDFCSTSPRWAGDNECKAMAFLRFAMFVANLDPGHCSLGAEGSNVHRIEATP